MSDAEDRRSPERGTLNFSEVRAAEARAIWARRERLDPEKALSNPDDTSTLPSDLVGVGLSGGGIRSASFCLGALQALHAFRATDRIDYLSTVSGGGYIGASMVAHMSANDGEFPFANVENIDASHGGEIVDPPVVGHIRNYSRYLFPTGLTDVIRSVGILARGLVVNAVLILAVILPLAALTILANPTESHLERSFVIDLVLAAGLHPEPWLASLVGQRFFVTLVLLAVMAVFAVFWGVYRSAIEAGHNEERLRKPEFVSYWASVWWGLSISLAISFIAEFQTLIIEQIIEFYIATRGFELTSIISSIASVAGASSALAIFRGSLINTIAKALDTPSLTTQIQALLAKLVLYVGALMLPLAIYFIYLLISATGIDFSRRCLTGDWLARLLECLNIHLPNICESQPQHPLEFPLRPGFMAIDNWLMLKICVGISVIVVIYSIISRRTGQSELLQTGYRLWTKLRQDGLKLWRPLIVMLVFIVLMICVAKAVRHDTPAEYWWTLWNYLLLSLPPIVIGYCFSENANALHGLYRDRLNQAFRLGRLTPPKTSMTLASLNTLYMPFILINATLNAVRGDHVDTATSLQSTADPATKPKERFDPARRGRHAEFFLFTPSYVGSDATGYVPTTQLAEYSASGLEQDMGLDLATAVAISGAAASSNNGRLGLGVLAPTLALLNIRLGYWLDNPRYANAKKGTAPLSWPDVFRLYLLQEAFGLLRINSRKVLLSDGGHIENIGLYQLLKRRCKVIIICDAEADPALNFGALADAQRFARIDLGHRVSIRWQPIREQSARRMRAFRGQATDADRAVPEEIKKQDNNQHFAIGEILYGKGESEDDKGILLYIKANMTGDEPDYVTDYERRYPTFPHETTADQLFSEEQMEAYRSLGFHSVSRALSPSHDPISVDAEKLMRRLKEILAISEDEQPPATNEDPALEEEE